jgi:hypothetical protein
MMSLISLTENLGYKPRPSRTAFSLASGDGCTPLVLRFGFSQHFRNTPTALHIPRRSI